MMILRVATALLLGLSLAPAAPVEGPEEEPVVIRYVDDPVLGDP